MSRDLLNIREIAKNYFNIFVAVAYIHVILFTMNEKYTATEAYLELSQT